MKKILAVIMAAVLVLSLGACGGEYKNTDISPSSQLSSDVTPPEEEIQPPITIEQLPLTLEIQEPNTIGDIYIAATITNNSDKTVIGYDATILLKDTNKKTYLSTRDTILPGETSPNFETLGSPGIIESGYEFLEYEITVKKDDGTKAIISYDCKLKEYEVRERRPN